MSITLISDSTMDLSPENVEKYNIKIVPLKVIFGEEVYKDYFEMQGRKFYEKLMPSKEIPKTSQPSPNDFVEEYKKYKYDTIISIHISSKFSGTYQSACIARNILAEQDITVIDSKSTSLGLGLMLIKIAKMIKEGRKKEEIITTIYRIIEQIKVFFTVDDLIYLERGGRIGKAQAFLGSLLEIKPILFLKDGEIIPYEKVRTKKKLVQRMFEILKYYVGDGKGYMLAIGDANVPEIKEEIYNEVKRNYNFDEIILSEIGAVIGTHTGPGTWGIAFLKT